MFTPGLVLPKHKSPWLRLKQRLEVELALLQLAGEFSHARFLEIADRTSRLALLRSAPNHLKVGYSAKERRQLAWMGLYRLTRYRLTKT